MKGVFGCNLIHRPVLPADRTPAGTTASQRRTHRPNQTLASEPDPVVSQKYFEADAGWLGGLGVTGTANACHDLDLSALKGIKPGFGIGLGGFAGTTYTATAVSPTFGSFFGH